MSTRVGLRIERLDRAGPTNPEEAGNAAEVVAHRSAESFDLVELPAPNEHHLLEVVRAHPQLIPAEDLGLDGPGSP